MSEPSEPVPEHKPFVPASQTIPELTVPAVVMGALLGLVFATSSTYLGLKIGLTVSASIPVAVLSITLFRWLKLKGTILENNIAQTTGSAGESLAAGVAFTLPSLMLMGFDIEFTRIMLVSLLGGLIGVLMMIPLRHGLIVEEHGKLSYPEGTACADVLIVGEKGGTEAKTVFIGFFIGLFYAFFNLISKLWSDTATFTSNFGGQLKKATLGFEVSPPMLGVGYIIGPKVAANMLGGGLLAFVVLIPMIIMFGGPEVAKMSPGGIRHDYVLYIGAGCVAAGGFISLGKSIPTIVNAFRRGLASLRVNEGSRTTVPRTERDLPMTLVLGGSLALAVAIFAAPVLNIDFMTALLVVVFGFFFVTVSSRITGEIGSSSNPISGMTIATLLLTCGLFVLIGRTGISYKAMALSTAALVCVAASNGGTISQDLKTGYLVGATPRLQQISIAIGVVTSAIVIGFAMLLFLGSRETVQPINFGNVVLKAGADTQQGPDGKSYHVAYYRDTGTLETGSYVVDEANVPRLRVNEKADPAEVAADPRKAYTAVSAGGVTLIDPGTPIAGSAGGPSYRLVQHTASKALVRGRYLVDDVGKPMFFIDPSVDAAYPYKLEKSHGKLDPAVAVVAAKTAGDAAALMHGKDEVGKEAGPELGVDRNVYRSIDLSKEIGGLRPGHYLLNSAGDVVYAARAVSKFDAPKAQLFALIIDGTLGGNLPWGLVLIGVFIAIILEMIGVSALPFAVGLYLPIYTSGGIFVGGVVRWLVDRKRKGESAGEAEFSPGMLMASGLIAGGSIAGVIQAGLLTGEVDKGFDWSHVLPSSLAANQTWWPMMFFVLMAAALYYIGVKTGAAKLPTATATKTSK
jgi:putative OPT family oligopeptide transporter